MRLRLTHFINRNHLLQSQPISLRSYSSAASLVNPPSIMSDSIDEIKQQIVTQSKLLTELQKDNKDVSQPQIRLTELRTALSALASKDKSAAKKAPAKVKYSLKTPKGTKDWHPSDMLLRQSIFKKITDVFQLHGAVTIDTPVFELREILAGKYGEDSKLIYDLQDQGGEICSLRYDLTVPFARFLAMYGTQYPNIKRYHIAKVYRRDQPVMTKGRMREFYQCDFDIAGVYDPMLPDAECLALTCEIFESLEIGDFTIKVNHRKILDGIFAVCGVPTNKTRAISSAVDKLDKMPWVEVRKEMTEAKGLDPEVADRIGEYVKLKGGKELVTQLQNDAQLTANKTAVEGLKDMVLLFKYLSIFGVSSRISFDLSLARGLDYYTGIIYEAVTEGSAPPPPPSTDAPSPTPRSKPKKLAADQEAEIDESLVGVGSIAAGGRYDELVGMFSPSNRIPCVGISFGVERIFSLLLKKSKENGEVEGRGKPTECFVINTGEGLLEERLGLVKELWDAGIKTEFTYKVDAKPSKQFAAIEKDQIRFAIILSKVPYSQGLVRVKEQLGKTEGEKQGEGVELKKEELVPWLLEKLGRK